MNVFLDTMVYLHCVPTEQIDFCDILRTDAVTLLVPRVTFKELDKHKTSHSSSRTRDRSRRVLSFLESQIESGAPLRKGVVVRFVPTMPQIDMAAHGLDPAWNDDLLIASVLEYREQHNSVDTVLVTHDTGARLTCRHLGIKTIELPEKYRLPPELDESEKENQRLRRELQKIQNALPKISVGFADEVVSTARFSLEQPKDADESQISAALTKQKNAVPELARKHTPTELADESVSQFASKLAISELYSDMIPDKEFARYNAERIKYLENYERYLRELVTAKNLDKRSIRFTIAISNSGSAPADDVDVHLHFPDGFSLYQEDDWPSLPSEPKPPSKPLNSLQILKSQMSTPNLALPQMRVPVFRPPSSFQMRRTNSYDISDHFTRIKHGFTEELPELFLTFDSYSEASSFNCDYEINVANMPEPIKGKLHFVVEKEASDQTPEDS